MNMPYYLAVDLTVFDYKIYKLLNNHDYFISFKSFWNEYLKTKISIIFYRPIYYMN